MPDIVPAPKSKGPLARQLFRRAEILHPTRFVSFPVLKLP